MWQLFWASCIFTLFLGLKVLTEHCLNISYSSFYSTNSTRRKICRQIMILLKTTMHGYTFQNIRWVRLVSALGLARGTPGY